MKICILGIDGYIGYPLALHLLNKGHKITGLDDGSRRKLVAGVGSRSLTPIRSFAQRNIKLMQKGADNGIADITLGNASTHYKLKDFLEYAKPDAIVHLAEQPSAPYSMLGPLESFKTQKINVLGTLDILWVMREVCPEAHLVKLGSMGEYGTPKCDIPEGRIPKECIKGFTRVPSMFENGKAEIQMVCPMKGLLFPRTAGSFYHLSKVHDTHNIEFACRNWKLRSTDIMQGIVFGLSDLGLTRFDYDEYFGTVINRFCAQAIIGHPLTVYGEGNQTRGFLPLKDSIQCLTIALENPPSEGEYRTFNQFESIHKIINLAKMVQRITRKLGMKVSIQHLPNPRKEAEEHYYNPSHKKLLDLGYEPTTDIESEITKLIDGIRLYRDKVVKEVIMPETKW